MRRWAFWLVVAVGMMLGTGVGSGVATAYATEVNKIPTDALKRAVLNDIDRIQRLHELGLRTYPVEGAVPSELTINWGNGVVHNAMYLCDETCASTFPGYPIEVGLHSTAAKWEILGTHGQLTETVHSGYVIDAVDDGEGGFTRSLMFLDTLGEVTGATGFELPNWPIYWYFGIEGGGNVVNFAVFGLTVSPPTWTFVGAGVAHVDGTTHDVVVFDNEAPEYALIAALIAVVMIAGVTAAGQAILAKFSEVADAIDSAPSSSR
jgi:Flp pilus assembly pilin Flp